MLRLDLRRSDLGRLRQLWQVDDDLRPIAHSILLDYDDSSGHHDSSDGKCDEETETKSNWA
jgi:hypothetical protein